MKTKQQLLIALFCMISSIYTHGFFEANGDDSFKKLNTLFSKTTCRKYACDELPGLFSRLNFEFDQEKLSDQQTLNLLKKIFLNDVSSARVSKLTERRTMKLLNLAQERGLLDSVQYKILEDTIESKNRQQTFRLVDYQRKLNSIKKGRGEGIPADLFKTLNNEKLRKKINALEDETPRQRLYLKFSSIQIKQMAQVLTNAIDLMTARQGRVQLDIEGDDIWDRTETLSTQEIYRLGMKLLYRDYTRLKSSPLFQKTDLQLIDLVSAALELGEIDGEVVTEILNMDALKIVEKGFFERHRNTFISLGKVGVTYFAPGGPFIVLAITLVESMAEGKKDYEKFSSDHLF